MLEAYRQYLEVNEFAALQTALSQPLYPAIRINTLKVGDAAVTAHHYAERFGWQLSAVPFCKSGWQITNHAHSLGQTLPHRMGLFYIQDAASMIPAEMFSDHPAPLVLDMAAAPGGKTTHLVSRFSDQACIVANDSSKKRIPALRANLQSWGAFGAMTTNYPGEKLGLWFPDTFDAVLLDAPCSGDTLREEKGRKKRHVSDKERTSLAQRQLALLTSAFYATRVGGEIVYSTCTLNPEENEGVLSALARNFPVEIEGVEGLPHTGLVAEAFVAETVHATRLWPHIYRTSGFFAARLRKKAHLALPDATWPTYKDAGYETLHNKNIDLIQQSLHDGYDFNFNSVMASQALILLQKKDSVYALPERLYAEFSDISSMSMGLLIGQLQGETFTPAHELISRFWGDFKGHGITIEDPQQLAIWLEGRDLRGDYLGQYPNGCIVLLENEYGEFIGRGKVQEGRIRNMLPKRVI